MIECGMPAEDVDIINCDNKTMESILSEPDLIRMT